MKNRRLIVGMLVFTALVVAVSCAKPENDLRDSIEGSYYGTIVRSSSLKSALSDMNEIANGKADVTLMGDHQIEVHCFGEDLDTLFILDYYLHNDSVLVCLTGENFRNNYGHMPGKGHMGGNMMDDIGSDETEWMHHLKDEHLEGDEHYGGFDMHNGTFNYSIKMMDESEPYYMIFKGSKKQ